MAEKTKKPTLNARVADIENCMDQILNSLETLLERTEFIESELETLKAENMRLNAEVAYIKPRLGLPV